MTVPVKGATLIGNGPEVLTHVSMVGKDLAARRGLGTCGKDGQSRSRRRRSAHHSHRRSDRRRHSNVARFRAVARRRVVMLVAWPAAPEGAQRQLQATWGRGVPVELCASRRHRSAIPTIIASVLAPRGWAPPATRRARPPIAAISTPRAPCASAGPIAADDRCGQPRKREMHEPPRRPTASKRAWKRASCTASRLKLNATS